MKILQYKVANWVIEEKLDDGLSHSNYEGKFNILSLKSTYGATPTDLF